MKKTAIYAHVQVTVGTKTFKAGDVVATVESDLDTQQLVTLLTGGRASDTPYEVKPAAKAPSDQPNQGNVEVPKAGNWKK